MKKGKTKIEMKSVTKYFRNAILASTQRTVDYKNISFDTISRQEIENGLINRKATGKIWKTKEDERWERTTKDVVIALKTIATEFSDAGYIENNIEEMTSILFLPAVISKDGILSKPDDKYPWIPREFLEPMVEPQIAIGKAEIYDSFFEETTDKRNQIKLWNDYLNYAKELYEKVTETKFTEEHIKKSQIKLDGKYYIFESEQVNSTANILRLYNDLLQNGEPLLYQKMTNGGIEPSRDIIDKMEENKLKGYVGQMGGEYSLSESQREAVSCFQEIEEGEVLAVNGPPGTGKTTLLQSIVANMYVKAALNNDMAPIIVATSTNNQAVTNIIDSFGKISPIEISNLECRWIKGVNSFAVYFPSASRMKEAESKQYQYTSARGGNFVDDIETDENREGSKELFVKEFTEYFGIEENSLVRCKEKISNSLNELNEKRIRCIDKLTQAKNILGQLSAKEYINNLNQKLEKLDEEIEKVENKERQIKADSERLIERRKEWRKLYNLLPWYVRLFKFLPCFRRKIFEWSFENIKEDELNLLKRGMDIGEIEDKYYKLVEQNDILFKQNKMEINNLIAKKKERQQYKEEIISKLFEIKDMMLSFLKYKVSVDTDNFIEEFTVEKVNDELDKIRYVEFWLAVHYYEALWLIEDNPISEKENGTNYENVINKRYHRIAMLAPCMVMTTFMLPKQFLAYGGNEKSNYYMYNYVDLLIVDEAGQISPEIGIPAFALAKKAVVVGDEKQIPPVWGIQKALDIAMAIDHDVISQKEQFALLQQNGLNCSESSVMKIASQSCPYEKYGKGLFLSEHRRCYDEIIQYCNDLVYNGNLEPLRGSENKSVLYDWIPATGHKQIEVPYSQKIAGSRQNYTEATEIVDWIGNHYELILHRYQDKNQIDDEKMLIGIITPFKKQSVLLKKLLREKLPDISSNISVGTVHTFQGAERKIIIFSSVYGNKDGCYFIDRNKSLMNVAVSRAKDSFLVFGDRGCLGGNRTSASGMLKKATYKTVNEDIE